MISFWDINYNNAALNLKQEICSSSISMHLSNKSILFHFQDKKTQNQYSYSILFWFISNKLVFFIYFFNSKILFTSPREGLAFLFSQSKGHSFHFMQFSLSIYSKHLPSLSTAPQLSLQQSYQLTVIYGVGMPRKLFPLYFFTTRHFLFHKVKWNRVKVKSFY